jgi:protein TonB
MFTIVTRDQKRFRRHGLVVSISLALHLAALTALLGAQLWQVPAIQEPPVNTVFLMLGPLPVPPPGGGTPLPRTVTPARQPPQAARTITQPDPQKVPATIPTPPDSPAPPEAVNPAADPNTSSSAPGPGNSVDGPGPGGPGPGTGPTGPGEVVDDAPLYLNANMVKPELIPSTKMQPRYTEMARKARLQGMVLLEAIIDERGNVVDVRALRRMPMGLTEEAMEAVTQWKFKPATLAGRPVKVYFTLRVDFFVH